MGVWEFAKVPGPRGQKSKQTKTIVPSRRKNNGRSQIEPWLRWSFRDWWNQTYCLLIPITSRGRPVFLVVFCHDLLCQDWIVCTPFLQKPKNFKKSSLAETTCADTGTDHTGIHQRSVRGVEPDCSCWSADLRPATACTPLPLLLGSCHMSLIAEHTSVVAKRPGGEGYQQHGRGRPRRNERKPSKDCRQRRGTTTATVGFSACVCVSLRMLMVVVGIF